jgi:hypothetical protein
MRLWPSQRLELLSWDHQHAAQVPGAVGVSPLQAYVSLLLVGEGCGIAKGVATMLGVRFGLVAGPVIGQPKERADGVRTLGELFEERPPLSLAASLLGPRNIFAFAPSEQTSPLAC